MLDAQQIKDMDGRDKLTLLEAFLGQAFPGATNGQIAEALGYSRRQVQEWLAHPDKIPAVVLLYLQELAYRHDADAKLRAFQGVAEAMEQLAGRFGDMAREMQA